MNTLGMDTALGACSVALIRNGEVVAHAREEIERGHAEALAPMVEAVMARSGLGFRDLDRIGVTVGPGTFTGQRVGLAFARALALALKIPAIGVTTLDAMAEEALIQSNLSWAVVLCDARRGEVYAGARAATGEIVIAPELLALEAAVARVVQAADARGKSFALAGTGAILAEKLFAAAGLDGQVGKVRQPDAIQVAGLAAQAEPSAHPPRPLYLRPPDAKLPARGRK